MTTKPATLPPHEQAARRARATIHFTPKPSPPTPPPHVPHFHIKYDARGFNHPAPGSEQARLDSANGIVWPHDGPTREP